MLQTAVHIWQDLCHANNTFDLKSNAGSITIRKRLDNGTFGTTFHASDGTRDGVLKMAENRPDARMVLQNECNMLRRITPHPGIIGVYEMHNSPYQGFIFMEHGGKTLFDMMEQTSAYDCDNIVAQIMNAVAHVHMHKVAHCDLKLENITINTTGLVKLIDFGLSAALGEDGMMTRVAGSGLYAAPELFAEARPFEGYKLDSWSCGVIAYALNFRSFPFHKSTAECPRFKAFEAASSRMCVIDYLHTLYTTGHAMPVASAYARYVINHCLQIDPAKRCYIHDPHAK